MKQRLPEYEGAYLNSLSHSQALTRDRVRDLVASGWSLAAVAEAFSPPKSRSSIRSWSMSKQPPLEHIHPPIPPILLTSAPAENTDQPDSPPSQSATKLKIDVPRRVYNPASPKVSPAQKKKISTLAPLARRYRARTAPGGRYATANRDLTDLCKKLYYSGASVRELSLAAGVTYRAMARRLGR